MKPCNVCSFKKGFVILSIVLDQSVPTPSKKKDCRRQGRTRRGGEVVEVAPGPPARVRLLRQCGLSPPNPRFPIQLMATREPAGAAYRLTLVSNLRREWRTVASHVTHLVGDRR